MSRRKMLVLIALTWAVAVALGVLPWVWPWYLHLISSGVFQWYEGLAAGLSLGYTTRYLMTRRR